MQQGLSDEGHGRRITVLNRQTIGDDQRVADLAEQVRGARIGGLPVPFGAQGGRILRRWPCGVPRAAPPRWRTDPRARTCSLRLPVGRCASSWPSTIVRLHSQLRSVNRLRPSMSGRASQPGCAARLSGRPVRNLAQGEQGTGIEDFRPQPNRLRMDLRIYPRSTTTFTCRLGPAEPRAKVKALSNAEGLPRPSPREPSHRCSTGATGRFT